MTAITTPDNADDVPDGYTYDAQSKPPPLGHAVKHFWGFDPSYVCLNHGSYGSLPLPVFAACTKLSLFCERNPDKFHRFEYMPLLKESRRRVAELVGAAHDEVVLVPNATHGLNTVLRNFEWREGDVLMGASTTYNAIERTIQYLADRSEQPRPTSEAVLFTFPMTHAEIVGRFRARIQEIKQAHPQIEFSDVPPGSLPYVKGRVGKNKFVVVIDSIVSNPGVALPWKEMVQVCREEGVWTVIDGAHSVGQEALNLSKAKPDFFVTNCHKWLYGKRGCAVLYVPERNQYIIKSSIPTSHSYKSPEDEKVYISARNYTEDDPSFVVQHEWTGTMDQIPFLSVPAALDFRNWLGGETVINTYCHNLAMTGGKRLAGLLGTEVMDKTGELTLNMTNVRLPLPVETFEHEIYDSDMLTEINNVFKERLLYEWNVSVGHYFHGGGWWCRCSAQVWNEISDFDYLANALTALCDEVKTSILARQAKL